MSSAKQKTTNTQQLTIRQFTTEQNYLNPAAASLFEFILKIDFSR